MHSGSQARHIFRSSQMSVVAKLNWKLSTNGKSCPLVSPSMSSIYFDLFKTYLLCPHFPVSTHFYQSASFSWKTNCPNKSVLLPCHELTKKKKKILRAETRHWQEGRYQHTAPVWCWFSGMIVYLHDAFRTTHGCPTHHCQGEAAQHNSKISCSA